MFPISSYFVYAVKPSSSQESPEVEETHEIPLQVPSLDQHLQTLRNLLGSLTVPASSEETPTVSTWTQRQLKREQKFRAAMPELLNLKLAAEIVSNAKLLMLWSGAWTVFHQELPFFVRHVTQLSMVKMSSMTGKP
ncbi:hypothetical protein F7725_028755 [Dissostichus mawsoni]|uniref:Uncharacterized protein n=1 Tax=Dissostichus mawsoni TaxID=36200 RepID=A0A7J5XHX1_DISMA|nr:hypothetical protein F7725_028755 [Dissostichus mawsoni]